MGRQTTISISSKDSAYFRHYSPRIMTSSENAEVDSIIRQLKYQEEMLNAPHKAQVMYQTALVSSAFIFLFAVFICALLLTRNKARLEKSLEIPMAVLQAASIVLWGLFSISALLLLGYLGMLASLKMVSVVWGG